MSATSHSLLVACLAFSLSQLFSDPWEKSVRRTQDNNAKGKNPVDPAPVPMELDRQIFSANLRTLTEHDYF
ncbi:hypothetical protein TNCV_2101291 [Trichonephila clavipes]|nr:hypothetical protein TNCV_2101291 [Trichonephila clavipes]